MAASALLSLSPVRPVAGLARPTGSRDTGRLLLGRRRGGLLHVLASPPAAGADARAASSDAPPPATQDDRRLQEARRARQEVESFKLWFGGFLLAGAVFSAFTGSPGMALLTLLWLAILLIILR